MAEQLHSGNPAFSPDDLTVDRLSQLGTEITTLRQSLEHAQRLATLGTIAGLIAHEFNNILTPVMSYAQMALADPDDRALGEKALEHALSGSEKAAHIAQAILGFARDEFGGLGDSAAAAVSPNTKVGGSDQNQTSNDPPVCAKVQEAVHSALACLAREPAKDGITLTIETGTEAAAIRPIALQQVLLNLILNARKAMSPGGGQLRISTRCVTGPVKPPKDAARTGVPQHNAGQCSTWNIGGEQSEPQGSEKWVLLEVADTGRGIERKRLSTMFEPFVTFSNTAQTTNNTTSNPEAEPSNSKQGGQTGTGLGLSVCRRLVEQAGGEIWAQSKTGEGTRFTLVLRAA